MKRLLPVILIPLLIIGTYLASNVQVFANTSAQLLAQNTTPATTPSPTITPPLDVASGVGLTVTLTDKDAADGSIVSFSNTGYHLSTVGYDPTVYGVISDNTSITLEDPETTNSQSRIVLTQGKVLVRVSTQNGPIKAGSLITSSGTPGVGQLATEDGFVVGTALDDFAEPDPKKVGTIFVSLNFGFNSQTTVLRKNLISNIKSSLNSPYLSPVNTFRYIIAGLAVLMGLGVGLVHFGRTTSNGIEALGRNPLARNAILFSMAVNLLLTVIAMGIGLAIAYFILVL